MQEPDFFKLPDPPDYDPHDRGVLAILLLLAILAAVVLYAVFTQPRGIYL